MERRDPTLAEVIREALENRLASVRVAMPARVERYDAGEQTVDAQPLVKRFTGGSVSRSQFRSLPVVSRVPVAFPRGGGFFVSFPIRPADTVLLLIADRCIDTWFASGAESEPLDGRMHHLADAIAIPGLSDSTNPIGSASDNDMVLGKDGGTLVRITSNGEILLGAATELVALASKVQAELQAVIDWAKTHTHPASGGPTGPPVESTALMPAQTVASSKVKAE